MKEEVKTYKNKLKLETIKKSFYSQQTDLKEALLLQLNDSKVNVIQKGEMLNNKLMNQQKNYMGQKW